jgi:hypothetical protein
MMIAMNFPDRRSRTAGGVVASLAGLILSALPSALPAQAPPLISVNAASHIFRQAQQICRADHGRLWGRSLCGPIMLVDPRGRRIVANERDAGGILNPEGGYFTGVLPKNENIANTAMPWSGTFWTQIGWPLPDDPRARGILVAHELFHRVAPKLDLPLLRGGDNRHLDTLDGRYLLQLEWRALSAALTATDAAARKRAIEDALIFRAERYRLFSTAQADEEALELNEGLAEYTGIRAGLTDPALQLKAALGEFKAHSGDGSFVRSFAYTTGPAYGLLLDRYSNDWRVRIRKRPRLDLLLAQAVGIQLPSTIHEAAEQRALAYDGPSLRTAEMRRDVSRQQVLAAYRKKFAQGPTVVVPLIHFGFQFDPTNLQPLDELGTVYPNLWITDEWGVLEVKNGALMSAKMNAVTLAGPATILGNELTGDGWTVELKPGWSAVAGTRPGDLVIKGPPA